MINKLRMMFVCLLGAMCFMGLPKKSFGQADWNWVAPFPQGNTRQNVAVVNDSLVYVSGSGGTILKTTDRGNTWEILYTGLSGANFYSIYFLNADTGYVAGTAGAIYRTYDGGSTWTSINSSISSFTGVHNSLYFKNANEGFIGSGQSAQKSIYKTTNGGTTWTLQKITPGVSFRDFSFVNDTGYVFAQETFNVKPPSFWRTLDGGQTWDSLTSIGTVQSNVWDICFTTKDTGYLAASTTPASGGQILKTTDAGVTWSVVKTSTIPFYTIHFVNKLKGYAVAEDVYVTSDGGLTWTALAVPNSSLSNGKIRGKQNYVYMTGQLGGTGLFRGKVSDNSFTQLSSNHNTGGLLSVDFYNNRMYAVGRGGNIYYSGDEGITWTKQAAGLTAAHLLGVAFPHDDLAIAVGRAGTILTKNGSQNWQITTSGTTVNLNAVSMVDHQFGYIAADNGKVLKTTDPLSAWTTIQADPGNKNLWGLHFLNKDTGFVVGANGAILKTVDGGNTWLTQTSGVLTILYNVHFITTNKGFAVGANGVILTTSNGGQNWTSVVSGTAKNLHGISFANTYNGWITGRDGTILKTTDGGATWTADEAITAGAVNAVYFKNSKTGWAVGSIGTADPYRTATAADFGTILKYSSQDDCPESDINADRVVDAADYLLFIGKFQTSCTCPEDINKDNQVNTSDFLMLISDYNKQCP